VTPDDAAEVLAIFAEAELFDGFLLWRVSVTPDGGRDVRLSVQCSDLFHWATADFEDVTTEDVPLLRATLDDLTGLRSSDEGELGHLFAARKRGMRPQAPCYKGMSPALAALYDACCTGQERAAADEEDAAWWIAVARKARARDAR
jgi:hypothetical protein